MSVEHLGNVKVCYSALHLVALSLQKLGFEMAQQHVLVMEQEALKEIGSEVTKSGSEELKKTENIVVPSYYTV